MDLASSGIQLDNMKRFFSPLQECIQILRSFLPMIIVYILNLLFAYSLGPFLFWPTSDIYIHILGGIVTAWSFDRLMRFVGKRKKWLIEPAWLYSTMLVGLTSAVAILWEVYEYIHDIFFYFQYQANNIDTMGDLSMGLAGGIFFACVIYFFQRRSHK